MQEQDLGAYIVLRTRRIVIRPSEIKERIFMQPVQLTLDCVIGLGASQTTTVHRNRATRPSTAQICLQWVLRTMPSISTTIGGLSLGIHCQSPPSYKLFIHSRHYQERIVQVKSSTKTSRQIGVRQQEDFITIFHLSPEN